MKKEYQNPKLAVRKITANDVISTSGDADGTIEEMPWNSIERNPNWDEYEK